MNFGLLRERARVYMALMRLDKPIGTLLLLWPTLWAQWLASDGQPHAAIFVSLVAGTFLMRSAGCVVNDYFDRDFDGAVARTANRPFAQKIIQPKEAFVLFGVLCVLALVCLIPLNHLARWLSLPALFLAVTYPLMKRFFPVPQLYLGLAFSFGIPMAYAAESHQLPAQAWWLYLANICWTLAYDTIYAMADKPDDLKIGIKTSAITFGDYDIAAAMFFHALFDLIMMKIGWTFAARWPYWLGLLATLYCQIRQYRAIASRDRAACLREFIGNNRIGMIVWLGIVLHFSLV